ncbi:hypothetical protein [Streptomyces sp. NPDC050504]|uniref:hypothetical protein n=1 Tax=Streptomyces sp. NPDC050504 TaxID=3365618 RepID=UPI0037877576
MSTTRHLINRQRRLATKPPERASGGSGGSGAPGGSGTATATRPEGAPAATAGPEAAVEPDGTAVPEAAEVTEAVEAGPDANDGATAPEDAPAAPVTPVTPSASRRRARLPVVLGALTVLLGGFAAFAFGQAGDLREDPSTSNTALTDIARTSEVKGQIGKAVSAVFSYNFADPAASQRTADGHLTGKAVGQHKAMLAAVREQGPAQKLVLTTVVTESGVELLDGDRARLLVYADQSNTRTAAKGGKAGETSYAAAMFAVDAVREKGTWRIANIDTFTG